MSRYSITDQPSLESWNSVLGSSLNGNFDQTIEYGEITKAHNIHATVHRILAMDNGKPVGIVQGICTRQILGFGVSMVVGGGHGSGPVTVAKGTAAAQWVKTLLIALENAGIRNRIVELKVWWPDRWGMHDVFRNLEYIAAERFNRFTVDLHKPTRALWNSIASNKRKNIRKATKSGVEVVQGCSTDDLETFFQMLQSSGKRAGFIHPPFSEFEATWRGYEPCRIFLARLHGKDVAGAFVVTHGKTVFARAAGSVKESWSVRPNDLLHWKIMEWACDQDFHEYHMGLVSEPVPAKGSRTWGLWRWKKEWNGNLEIVRVFQKALYLPQIANAIAFATKRYGNLTPRQQRLVMRFIRHAT